MKQVRRQFLGQWRAGIGGTFPEGLHRELAPIRIGSLDLTGFQQSKAQRESVDLRETVGFHPSGVRWDELKYVERHAVRGLGEKVSLPPRLVFRI